VLARDVALAVQAALLRRHSPDFVFEAFCESRLRTGDSLGAFGSLGRDTAFDALLARANPIQ
jgi:putative acyl-CoA dehydrogenase